MVKPGPAIADVLAGPRSIGFPARAVASAVSFAGGSTAARKRADVSRGTHVPKQARALNSVHEEGMVGIYVIL